MSCIFTFITLSELYYGAYKSQKTNQNLANVGEIADKLGIIESNQVISETFGELKATLEKAGNVIDDADLFIASCALVNHFTLVTNNQKYFKRITGLKLDNWLK